MGTVPANIEIIGYFVLFFSSFHLNTFKWFKWIWFSFNKMLFIDGICLYSGNWDSISSAEQTISMRDWSRTLREIHETDKSLFLPKGVSTVHTCQFTYCGTRSNTVDWVSLFQHSMSNMIYLHFSREQLALYVVFAEQKGFNRTIFIRISDWVRIHFRWDCYDTILAIGRET